MFNGLGTNLSNLSKLADAKTRSLSAENFDGKKGGGGQATEGTCKKIARDLGQKFKVSPSVIVGAKSTFTAGDIEGPGAIQSMWITCELSRDFIIRIYWDDQETPSVECPVQDFFAFSWGNVTDDSKHGTFPHVNSVPVMVAPARGMNCFWEMPFRKRAKITFENRSDKDITLYYQINYALAEVDDDCAYFHASFRRTNPVKYKEDHIIIDNIKGKGQYVGTVLAIGLNGANGWWGEGEIKFFMDGDNEFPTICGTGTEDYFGGAYNFDVNGGYVTYSGPYMGMHQVIQPDGLYVSQQRFCMYRWHIVDPIRFESDLRVTIQDLGWREGMRFLPRQDDIATVAFWYQTLPSAPLLPLPDSDEMEII